jgi:hypothetical protein
MTMEDAKEAHKDDQRTPFQREFRVNDEFYTGREIRDAIQRHFPLGRKGFQGLAFVVAREKCHYPMSEEELKTAIPDKPVETEHNPRLHSCYIYAIYESRMFDTRTVFHPTDLGYICDAQYHLA